MTNQNFEILRANTTHLFAIAPLFDLYRQFYGQVSNLSEARSFLLDRLTKNESVIFLALSYRNAKNCLGFLQLYPSFSSVSAQRIWILNDLFVVSEARQQGIATALMEKAKSFAQETQAKKLTLSTAIDNVNAQKLYERLGYQKDEEFFYYALNI
jgi:ribosomal protein S18 acetylase RimI-like enzyme